MWCCVAVSARTVDARYIFIIFIIFIIFVTTNKRVAGRVACDA
jgi:hypothetical protein